MCEAKTRLCLWKPDGGDGMMGEGHACMDEGSLQTLWNREGFGVNSFIMGGYGAVFSCTVLDTGDRVTRR